MSTLCYIAIPQPWESPKGLLMRTALHNGYCSVSSLCFALNAPCPNDTLELLTENSSLFSKLTLESPDILFGAITYRTHDTKDSYWGIDNVNLTRPQFSKRYRYCPQCLQKEIATVFPDIKSIGHCPLHMIQLISQCPNCKQTETWTNANLTHCKCGFDRRTAPPEPAILVDKNRLQVFGGETYIKKLSSLTQMAITCGALWTARTPKNCTISHDLLPIILQHAASMINHQICSYPNFTRAMHQAPWMEAHALLKSLAESLITKQLSQNTYHPCLNDKCCLQVTFSLRELHFAIGGNSAFLWESNFIENHFIHDSVSPYSGYYTSLTPICVTIKQLINRIADYNIEKNLLISKHYKISEAAALLECTTVTVSQLIRSGHLKSNQSDLKPGPKNPILVTKISANEFFKNHVLIKEISNLLDTTPSKAYFLLNQLNIIPASKSGSASIYDKIGIHEKLHELRQALLLNDESFAILSPTDEAYSFTAAEAANMLGISVTFFHHRFVQTRIIAPRLTSETKLFSATQIEEARTHLRNNLSIREIGDILGCSRKKTISLIDEHHLEPSCILSLCTGYLQPLYEATEIRKIISSLTNHPSDLIVTREADEYMQAYRPSEI